MLTLMNLVESIEYFLAGGFLILFNYVVPKGDIISKLLLPLNYLVGYIFIGAAFLIILSKSINYGPTINFIYIRIPRIRPQLLRFIRSNKIKKVERVISRIPNYLLPFLSAALLAIMVTEVFTDVFHFKNIQLTIIGSIFLILIFIAFLSIQAVNRILQINSFLLQFSGTLILMGIVLISIVYYSLFTNSQQIPDPQIQTIRSLLLACAVFLSIGAAIIFIVVNRIHVRQRRLVRQQQDIMREYQENFR